MRSTLLSGVAAVVLAVATGALAAPYHVVASIALPDGGWPWSTCAPAP